MSGGKMRSRRTGNAAAPTSPPHAASLAKNAAAPASSPHSASRAAASAPASSSSFSSFSSSSSGSRGGSAAAIGSGREEERGAGLFFWQQQQQQQVSYGRVLQSILLHADNRQVLQQFLFFALLLAAVPVPILLVLPQVLQYLWGDPKETSAAAAAENADRELRAAAAARNWAAVAAIISVNLIALSYAYSAYREEVADWRLVSQQHQHGATPTAEAIAAEGIAAEAFAAEAFAAEAITAEGMAAEAITAEGMAAEGIAAEGMAAEGMEADALAAGAEGREGRGDAGNERKGKDL